jgi:hypothetical protein
MVGFAPLYPPYTLQLKGRAPLRRPIEGRTMNIAQIKTKGDYRRVLEEIERLMTAKRNTREGDRLDVLVTLLEAWECKHYPLERAA